MHLTFVCFEAKGIKEKGHIVYASNILMNQQNDKIALKNIMNQDYVDNADKPFDELKFIPRSE